MIGEKNTSGFGHGKPPESSCSRYRLSGPAREILLFFILALAVRLYCFVGLGFNDDSVYTGYASVLFQGREFVPVRGYLSTRLAVIFPIVISWKLFGISQLSTALYFLLCGAGSVALTYRLADLFFGAGVARTAALLMCVFPINVVCASQFMPDVPLHFFSILMVTLLAGMAKDGVFRFWPALGCGLALGVAYLTKAAWLLLLPLMALTILLAPRFGNGSGRPSIRCSGKAAGAILAGFLLLFVPAQLYFSGLTGESFAIEKFRYYATTHDRNADTDFGFYPKAMLNMTENLYGWTHGIPSYGFLYWTLLFAFFVAVARRKKSLGTLLFWFWFGGIFFFFQYGLYLYASHIGPIGHPRQLRYLVIASAPVSILVGWALQEAFFSSGSGRLRAAGVVLTGALAVTSFGYARAGARFLHSGMQDVRRTVEYLEALPKKPIYLPDSWSQSKFYFFAKYDYDGYRGRLHTYRFAEPRQPKDADTVHEQISDAYVVVDLSPYSYGSRDRFYPDFCRKPPAHWVLLEKIDVPSRGLFEKYNPRIFYAPPSATKRPHGPNVTPLRNRRSRS